VDRSREQTVATRVVNLRAAA
jgi:hypothetical protein